MSAPETTTGGPIVVLVSGTGSNMLALADACERGDVPGQIAAVLADRECTGIEAARSRGIAANVVPPGAFASRDEWSAALADETGSHDPDLIVSAGFMRILSPVFIDRFYGRLINLHPSLLPAFPGAHAVRDALDFGVKVTGSTVHFIDREVDQGPVFLQEAVPVDPGDDEASLHHRIKEVEHRLLPEAARLFLEGRVRIEGRRVLIAPAS